MCLPLTSSLVPPPNVNHSDTNSLIRRTKTSDCRETRSLTLKQTKQHSHSSFHGLDVDCIILRSNRDWWFGIKALVQRFCVCRNRDYLTEKNVPVPVLMLMWTVSYAAFRHLEFLAPLLSTCPFLNLPDCLVPQSLLILIGQHGTFLCPFTSTQMSPWDPSGWKWVSITERMSRGSSGVWWGFLLDRSPWIGVSGMSNQEEALRMTQDTLERWDFSTKTVVTF